MYEDDELLRKQRDRLIRDLRAKVVGRIVEEVDASGFWRAGSRPTYADFLEVKFDDGTTLRIWGELTRPQGSWRPALKIKVEQAESGQVWPPCPPYLHIF